MQVVVVKKSDESAPFFFVKNLIFKVIGFGATFIQCPPRPSLIFKITMQYTYSPLSTDTQCTKPRVRLFPPKQEFFLLPYHYLNDAWSDF